jgi:hypothetical protein
VKRKIVTVLLGVTNASFHHARNSESFNKKVVNEREKAMRNRFLLGGANKMFECGMIP